MQNRRGGRDMSDPFGMFSDFGNFGGLGGSLFGRSSFDDPFFTRPFGSMFDQRIRVDDSRPAIEHSEPLIQELASDDDGEDAMEKVEGSEKGVMSNNEPFVDHPDDNIDGKTEPGENKAVYNKADSSGAPTFKVQSCKVTYGGVDGVYYTSSSSRRMGNDGVIMEECKEADKTTCQATHRISRGLHDKGHSFTRKLNSDGKVETSQKLHNMNEDELGGFEEAWKGNTGMHMPPWSGPNSSGTDRVSGWGGLLLPSARNVKDCQRGGPSNGNTADASNVRTRKVVRIPIE